MGVAPEPCAVRVLGERSGDKLAVVWEDGLQETWGVVAVRPLFGGLMLGVVAERWPAGERVVLGVPCPWGELLWDLAQLIG